MTSLDKLSNDPIGCGSFVLINYTRAVN